MDDAIEDLPEWYFTYDEDEEPKNPKTIHIGPTFAFFFIAEPHPRPRPFRRRKRIYKTRLKKPKRRTK